jgi:hypothetical protein
MPLNEASVGKTYPRVRVEADAERVASFAAAVDHRLGGVPPTFATVPEIAAGLAHVIADRDLGLDLSSVLHGEQEYEWSRPFDLGEAVTAESTITGIRGRGSMRFLTIETKVRDASEQVVVLARTTLVVRGDT